MAEKLEGQTEDLGDNKDPVELTATEEKALAEGWVPQDEWEGDPDQWRPAKEFLDRGELFKKIEDQNRTVKELKKALVDLQSHHKQVREVEYKRAIMSLKAQRKTALQEGDVDAVVELEDKIDLVREEQTKLKDEAVADVPTGPHPDFTAWNEKNRWYNSDRAMTTFADAIGKDLAEQGYSPREVLQEVEKQVKQEFPHKFRNPNKDKATPVEGSTGKESTKGDDIKLSDDERRVMQRFVRTGVMTEKEYMAELKRVKAAQ